MAGGLERTLRPVAVEAGDRSARPEGSCSDQCIPGWVILFLLLLREWVLLLFVSDKVSYNPSCLGTQ